MNARHAPLLWQPFDGASVGETMPASMNERKSMARIGTADGKRLRGCKTARWSIERLGGGQLHVH